MAGGSKKELEDNFARRKRSAANTSKLEKIRQQDIGLSDLEYFSQSDGKILTEVEVLLKDVLIVSVFATKTLLSAVLK